jgi:N-acetylglutamate synthase-like GNAT family acetyltransferase
MCAAARTREIMTVPERFDALSRVGSRPPRLIAYALKPGERGALAKALVKARLPVDDLDASGPLFWRFETADSMPVGFGGLELHGEDALLRSLVILPPVRSRGVGAAVVAQLESEAALRGCRAIWLLSEAAAGFFDRLGYAKCDRAVVPQSIRETRQFAALCPASADVLVKRLPA